MPKGYVILTEAINDPEGMKAYARAAGPAMVNAGVLVASRSAEVLEGQWHGDQTVVLEFDSVEAARAWYESEGYQNAKALREKAATTNAVILAGFESPRPS